MSKQLVHTYSFTVMVLVDALSESAALSARREVNEHIQTFAIQTPHVPDESAEDGWADVSICPGDLHDWKLEEILEQEWP